MCVIGLNGARNRRVDMIKLTLYGVACGCFFAAGTIDFCTGEVKQGIIAVAFGAINIVIFFF